MEELDLSGLTDSEKEAIYFIAILLRSKVFATTDRVDAIEARLARFEEAVAAFSAERGRRKE